jgi:hypothetical protein
MRWGVEGEHRPVKSKLQLESFSCKTELPIRQDFFAVAYIGLVEEDFSSAAPCRATVSLCEFSAIWNLWSR